MPVKVNVPVHIVIDPEAATSHLDHVETALTAAVRRALLNARATLRRLTASWPASTRRSRSCRGL